MSAKIEVVSEAVDNSDELNYLAVHICQTLIDLESEWKEVLYLKKTILQDEKVKFLMNMKDKWVNLFMSKNNLSAKEFSEKYLEREEGE